MHLFDFSLVCVNKCLLKSPAWDYAKSHRLHLFDFSPLCVSNVYWTSFDQHRQSHTGCIHLTFLQCEFSNVSSNGRPAAWGDTKSHWLHLFGFSPLCVSKCLLKELGSAQAKSHRMHFFCVRYQMVLKMPVCGEVKSHKAARQLLLLLQGKGNHLQNGVLLHLLHLVALHYHVTPVWRSTWSGSALCVFKCLFKVFE